MKSKLLSATGLVALLCAGCGDSDTVTNTNWFQNNQATLNRYRMGDAKAPSAAELAEYLKVLDLELEDGVDVSTRIAVPPQVDLTHLAPPPANQRSLGSCAAFAYGYGLGTVTTANTTRDVTRAENQVSPAYVYKQALGVENYRELPTNYGVFASSVLTALLRDGSASFANVPYPQTDEVRAAAQYIFDLPLNQSSLDFTIGSWASFNSSGADLLEDIKQRLAANQLVGFDTDLYPGFGEWSSSGVFSSTAAPEANSYHAMLIVGYDDARGALRVQNSWGDDWGDRGYIWLSYDTFLRTEQKSVFLANPYERTAPAVESTGSLLTAQGGPAGQITSVLQDQSRGEQSMVLRYRFDDAVTVTNVTVGQADQALNVLVRNGKFHWIRRDGHSYPTGSQPVTVTARTRDGLQLTYTGSVNVPALAGFTPAPPPAEEAGSNGQDPP